VKDEMARRNCIPLKSLIDVGGGDNKGVTGIGCDDNRKRITKLPDFAKDFSPKDIIILEKL
jgi:hypothetical protein